LNDAIFDESDENLVALSNEFNDEIKKRKRKTNRGIND